MTEGGTGVDVAIIDSGINPGHPHVGGVAGGVGFDRDDAGRIIETADFIDQIGHGTAIAGVIRREAPAAGLYSVKIFRKTLTASMDQLLAALKWAVQNRIKVIHMSLGLDREEAREDFDTLCRQSANDGLVIIASARGPDDRVLPAALESVIGVWWDRECDKDRFSYHPGSRVSFGAYGYPRPLPGLPPERNFHGHSFAAARVTGQAAKLLLENPAGDAEWVIGRLIELARSNDGGV